MMQVTQTKLIQPTDNSSTSPILEITHMFSPLLLLSFKKMTSHIDLVNLEKDQPSWTNKIHNFTMISLPS